MYVAFHSSMFNLATKWPFRRWLGVAGLEDPGEDEGNAFNVALGQNRVA
jgi:hypothetical protein